MEDILVDLKDGLVDLEDNPRTPPKVLSGTITDHAAKHESLRESSLAEAKRQKNFKQHRGRRS